MKLNSLFSGISVKKKSKLLGRGIGSGKGKTSGRGHKGQKARTGVSINGFAGGQQSIFTCLPKRGFKSLTKCKKQRVINLGTIISLVNAGVIDKNAVIDKSLLLNCGLITSIDNNVKILAKNANDSSDILKNLEFKLGNYDNSSKAVQEKVKSISFDAK